MTDDQGEPASTASGETVDVHDRTERRDREINACLSQIIPVLYGALLSYAMYSIAETALQIRQAIPLSRSETDSIGLKDGVQRLLMSGLIFAYVINDVGELLRLDTRYKFKSTARFSQEIWIALLYLLSFAYIRSGSYLAVVWLGLSLVLSGTWCNSLNHEYADDPDKIANLAVALRFASYAGAAMFIPFGLKLCRLRPVFSTKTAEVAYPFITFQPYAFTPLRTAIFCVTWCTWWYFCESWAMFWSGPDARRYLIRYLAPPGDQRLIKRTYAATLVSGIPLFRVADSIALRASHAAQRVSEMFHRLRQRAEDKRKNLDS